MGVREEGFGVTRWGRKIANKQAVCVEYPVLKVHLVSLRVAERLENCILSLSKVPPRHASARYPPDMYIPRIPTTCKYQVAPNMQGPGTPQACKG